MARWRIAAALPVVLLQLGVMVAAAGATQAPSSTPSGVNASLAVSRINTIRLAHGLPVGTPTNAYAAEVAHAAITGQDPTFAPLASGIVSEFSVWGMAPYGAGDAAPTPATVVNAWVVHDGWQGSAETTWNLDCTSPTASGCNGHRRAILSTPPVPGAKLFVDVATRISTLSGTPAISVAALLVWRVVTPQHP